MFVATQEQKDAVELSQKVRCLKLNAAAGASKSQPVWAKVQTPQGPQQIGNLSVGDYVFGSDGKPTKVLGIFPQGVKETYQVQFRDGSATWCSADHLWSVKRKNYPKSGYRVATLQEMMDDGLEDSDGNMRYRTPLAKAVQYPANNHILHPYLLGWMLGDGYLCGKTPAVSVAERDSEAIRILASLLPPGYNLNTRKTSENCTQSTIAHENGRGGVPNAITSELQRLGLRVKSGEKFIPLEYLQDSKDNRLSLLRGLMDTDGSVSGNRTKFVSTSKRLIEDVATLAQSLGFVVVRHAEQCTQRESTLYALNIKATENPFLIATKASKWGLSVKNPPSKYIKSCILLGMDQHVCIKVEAEDSLYLTDEFNVTHNTTTCTLIAEANPVPSLYLAFNKAMAEDAKGRFPDWVEVRTTHSLAYRAVGKDYRHKLQRPSGPYKNVGGTGSEVAKLLMIPARLMRTSGVSITSNSIGCCVLATVARFEQSADAQVGEQHVSLSAIPEKKQKMHDFPKASLRGEILKHAQKLWSMRKDLDSPVLANHDTYLKLYQLSKPVLSDYQMIYLDEYQDTSLCAHDIAMQQQHAGVVAVGDTFQNIYCQPAGTKVAYPVTKRVGRTTTTSIIEKCIEDVKVGDRVLSYDLGKTHMHTTGKEVTKFGSRYYSGTVVDVVAGENKTTYTADHECLARLGGANKDKYVCYLMRKGSQFRVGRVPFSYKTQNGIFGPAQRASVEGAQCLWILGIYDTEKESAMAENIYSYKYGLPQVCFKSPHGLKESHMKPEDFWESYGDNTANAERLLKELGMRLDSPVWIADSGRRRGNLAFRFVFEIKACNLFDGLEVAVIKEEYLAKKIPHRAWTPIKISKREWSGEVYSMEVAGTHNYVGDGVLTHNCWRGAVNLMETLEWPSSGLTKSFRFGQEVADLANEILRDQKTFEYRTAIVGFENADTKVMSAQEWYSLQDKPKQVTKIYRTNAFLLADAVEDIRAGKSVNICVDVGNFIRCLESGIALFKGDKGKVKHDTFIGFDNWKEVQEEAEYNKEYARLVNMITDSQIYSTLDTLRKYSPPKDYSVNYSTAHKMKGLEADVVVLAEDFASPFDKSGNWIGLQQEEQNLLYVALTRAKKLLVKNNTIEEMLCYYQDVFNSTPIALNVKSIVAITPDYANVAGVSANLLPSSFVDSIASQAEPWEGADEGLSSKYMPMDIDKLVQVEMVKLAGGTGLMSDLDKFVEGVRLSEEDDHWQNMDMDFQGLPN